MKYRNAINATGASVVGTAHAENEDLWGFSGRMAWVIDGATQPLETVDGAMTAAQYVRALDHAIRAQATDDRLALADVIATAVKEASRKWSGGQGPAATVAAVRLVEQGLLEWLVLGDAGIIINTSTGIEVHRDCRLSVVAVRERLALREAREKGVTGARLDELAVVLYKAERAARNRDGGYWVLADDETALRHALVGRTVARGPIVLATDGLFDGVRASGLWSTVEEAYHDIVQTAEPEATVLHVQEHISRKSAAPVKVDDTTVMLVEVDE